MKIFTVKHTQIPTATQYITTYVSVYAIICIGRVLKKKYPNFAKNHGKYLYDTRCQPEILNRLNQRFNSFSGCKAIKFKRYCNSLHPCYMGIFRILNNRPAQMNN